MTQRIIAYYEGQTDHPPTTLLPSIAKALKITTQFLDTLIGREKWKKKATG